MEPLPSYTGSIVSDASPDHGHVHGVCWTGVIAGALTVASLGIILLTLGFGLGLSSVSPWAYKGVSGKTIAEGTIAWLVFSQIVASGMGGYLAGRLRHRWSRVHADEVHFRDSAQGFLAWALALVVAVSFLTSAGSGFSAPTQNSVVAQAQTTPGALAGAPTPSADGAALPSDNSTASAVEANRKAAAYGALWLFISLLAGAFSAAIFATVGGRHRHHLHVYVA